MQDLGVCNGICLNKWNKKRKRRRPVEVLIAFKLQMVSQSSCWGWLWLTKKSIVFEESEVSSGLGTASNSSWVNSNSASLSIRSSSDIWVVNSSILCCNALTFSKSIPKTPWTLLGCVIFLTTALCWAANEPLDSKM